MYRIRFHGRGGQGMKTASRILGSAFFHAGWEVQDAPRYGAERRGAPIFAYVRADQQPIYERGIITAADLVVVADDSLVAEPAAGVLAGIDAHTILLINSHTDAETWRQRLNTAATILILPVDEDVIDRAELKYIGASCAGAAARLIGCIEQAHLTAAIDSEFAGFPTDVIAHNLEKALFGFAAMAERAGSVSAQAAVPAESWPPPQWVDLQSEPASVAAPVIHDGLTSVEVRTGLWRTLRPVLDESLCKKCWWVCSTFCPDGVIAVSDEGYPVVDYDHCKGCMVCVAQCPSHALIALPEEQAVKESL